MSDRDYQFYTDEQKRFLRLYAERLGFQPGTRTPDGVWTRLAEDFHKKFKRRVDTGRLAFQARTLWKGHQEHLPHRRVARRRKAMVSA